MVDVAQWMVPDKIQLSTKQFEHYISQVNEVFKPPT